MATAPDSKTSDPQTGPARGNAAERWADYARTASLYPASSPRVLASFASVLEAVKTKATDGGLRITMTQDELAIGDAQTEIAPDSKAAWLRERLRSGGLDGVVFRTSLTLAALQTFTARLTEIHTRGHKFRDNASRWPTAYAGVELIHRAFDGGFNTEDDGELGLRAADGDDPDAYADGGLDHDAEPGNAHLVGRLCAEGPVSASVTRISERLAGITLPGESEMLLDRQLAKRLLGYVVQCIPSEDRNSYDSTVSSTNNILSSMEEILLAEGSSTEALQLDDDVNLRALVYAASRRLFSREMPPLDERETEDRGTRGHAGDDEVLDDLSGLLLELNGLPISHSIRIEHDEIDKTVEQFRTLLWFYLQRDDEIDVEALLNRTRRLLSEIREDELPAMRALIETQLGPDADESTRSTFVRFFTDARQAGLLRICGVLTPDVIAREFPRDFGVFVDGVDLGRPEDRADLNAAISGIPPERIVGSIPALLDGPESLLIQGRAARLLGTGNAQLLPFVEAALALPGNPCRDAVIQFLREVGRENPATALLEVSTEPTAATTAYLRGVARSIQYNGTFPEVLDHQLEVLKGLVNAHGTSDRAKQRVIRALGRLGGPEAINILRRMAKKKFGLVSRESSDVRLAAREVLDWMSRKGASDSV